MRKLCAKLVVFIRMKHVLKNIICHFHNLKNAFRRKRMKKRNFSRVLSLIMAAVTAVSAATAESVMASGSPPSVGNTKVELLDEPYSINTKDPAFSWAMYDGDYDEVQTAYRIVVGTTRNNMESGSYVADTDWVSSAESSYVKAGLGGVLEDNALYYWSVQIKDKDGNTSDLSKPQAFTTEVGSGWESIDGIWVDNSIAPPSIFETAGWTDYAVEMDIAVTKALGIVFRATDSSNFYFLQFRSDDNTVRPHKSINGSVSAYGTNLTSPVTITQDEMVHIKLEIFDDAVTSYILDENDIFQEIGTTPLSDGLDYGSIGFRTGNSENGSVDNIIVYKLDEKDLEGRSAGSKSQEDSDMKTDEETEPASIEETGLETDTESDRESFVEKRADLGSEQTEATDGTESDGEDWTGELNDGLDTLQNTKNEDTNGELLADETQTEPVEQQKKADMGAESETDTEAETEADTDIESKAETEVETEVEINRGEVRQIDEEDILYSQDFSDGGTADFPGTTVADEMLEVAKSTLTRLAETAVGGEDSVTPKGNFVFLRDSFEIDDHDEIEKAVVSVTAKSPEKTRQYVYNLYMNGQFVGLGPARYDTNPADGKGILYYESYDVTDFIRSGENVIGSINYTKDEKSFLCQMTVYYEDGSKEVLTNSGAAGSTWKAKDGTAAFGSEENDIGTNYFSAGAENINANNYPFGWNEPDYDDSLWTAPESKGAIVGTYDLAPYDSDKVKRYERSAVSVVDKGNGNYFIDLGKEIVGGVYLDVDSPESSEIEIRCGEELSGTNTVKYNMRTGNNYVQYWTLKKGEQRIENIGMKTFRYIEVLNSPVEITTDNIGGIAMHQEFDEDESYFESSDEVLNTIYDTMKYSIKATNQNLMVDSQSRERGAYEGDVVINALSSYAFEDDYTLARFTNEYLAMNRTWPLEYVLYTIINAWNDYQYTGNLDSLSEYYDAIRGSGDSRLYWGQFDSNYNLLKIVTSGQNTTDAVLVDWPASEQDNYDRGTYNTVMNAVAYGAYASLANIAEALGETGDRTKYQGYADTIKSGMIEHLYDEEAGAFRDGVGSTHYSQHATAFSLAYGVYEDQDMAIKLAESIKDDGAIKTSVYGSWFVLEGLYNAGDGRTAMDFLLSRDTRSWYHMIYELGATISTEAWDPANKSNMTYSHPWGTAAGSQIVQGLFGIKPLEAGFSKFQIKIQPGDLSYAAVKTPTMKGSIEASYSLGSTGGIATNVLIPANTTAEVSIPAMGQDHGILLINNEVVQGKYKDGFFMVELGSGDYSLEVPSVGETSLQIKDDSGNYFVGDSLVAGTVFTDTDGTETDGAEMGTIEYTSNNSATAAVNKNTGRITLKGEGTATITSMLTLENVNIAGVDLAGLVLKAEKKINVETAKIKDIYIEADDVITIGEKAEVNFINEYENGKKVTENSVEISSDDTDTAYIDGQGNLVGKAAGTVKLTALLDDSRTIADDFVYEYDFTEVYADDFDSGKTTFNGVATDSGAAYFAKGSKVYYQNAEAAAWTDYTYAGKFKVDSNCGNLTFRVQDGSTFYLWQFDARTSTLKKHVFKSGINSDGYNVLGTTNLTNLKMDDYNDFKIIVDGKRFITYLNGEVQDITVDDTLIKGSIGVRNGSSEASYLDDLVVSTQVKIASKQVKVEAAAKLDSAESLLDKAEQLDRTLYTEASLKAVDILAEELAELVEDSPESSKQAAIDAKVKELEQAIAGLIKLPADTSNLTEMVKNSEQIRKGNYTDDSYAALTTAIKNAKALLAKELTISEQNQVDAQLAGLIGAITNLKQQEVKSPEAPEKKDYANLTELNKQIQKAKKMKTQNYTSKSVTSMKSMLTAAEQLATAKPEKSLQKSVDITAAALKSSIANLEKKLVNATKISKLKRSGKGKLTVTWKKNSSAKGYAIEYSTYKNFKTGVKTKKIKNYKTTKTVLKNLKSKKTYYVRIRGYKKINGTVRWGNYSNTLKLKVK